MFEIKYSDLAGRIGVIHSNHGKIETPAFVPVIHPVRQSIPAKKIRDMGFDLVITNAYITMKRHGDTARKKGIHKIIDYDGCVMTDSGGYQVLEYGEVDVKPRLGFKLEIKNVISTNSDISIKYKKDEKENEHVVAAILKDTATVGVLTGNIQILTNSERQSRVIIPFSGEVLGDVRLYPSHLYFGVIKKDNKYVKSVFITLLKENIRVDRIEVQPDFLTSEIITDPRMNIDEEEYVTLHSNFWEASTDFSQKNILEKNSIPLRILTRINGNAPVGEIEGVLKVYTNSKIQPIINIPVSAEIID